MLRGSLARERLDEAFFLVWPNHHDDLVSGKVCKGIAHRDAHVSLSGGGVHGFARQYLSGSLRHLLRVTERLRRSANRRGKSRWGLAGCETQPGGAPKDAPPG